MAKMSEGGAAEPRLGAMAWVALAIDWIRENPNRPPERAGRLYRQLPRIAPLTPTVLDLAVDRGSERPLKEWEDTRLQAAVELKWTGKDFKKQLDKALRQLRDVSSRRKVVVVGANSFSSANDILAFLPTKLRDLNLISALTSSVVTRAGDALAFVVHAQDVRWIIIVGAIEAFPALLGYLIADGIPRPTKLVHPTADPNSVVAREAFGNDLGRRLLDRLEERLKPWWKTTTSQESDAPYQDFSAIFIEEHPTEIKADGKPAGNAESISTEDEGLINWLTLLQSPWNSLAADYLRLVQRSIRRERWRELIETHVRTLLERIEKPLPERLSSRGTVSPMPIRLGVRRNGRLLTRYGRAALTVLSGGGKRNDPTSREAVLVLGSAGVGKTTILESIFKAWIEESLLGGEVALIPLVPVWLDLQELTESDLSTLESGKIGQEQHRLIVEFLVRNAAARANFAATSEAKGSALPGLASLLQVAPLIIVIDGWDQIAGKPLLRERIHRLLRALAGEAFPNVRKILLSSRPAPEVADVLRAAIAGRRKWRLMSLWLEPPDDRSRKVYIEEWFSFATTSLDRDDRRRVLWEWEPFRHWFDRSFNEIREVARWHRTLLAGRIQANPLLLTLALVVYFERTYLDVGPAEQLQPFRQIAELFETLFERLRVRDETMHRGPKSQRSRQEIPLPFSIYESNTFRPLLEALCFETLTGPHAAVGALIPSVTLDNGMTVGSRLSVLGNKLRTLGWPSFSSLPFIFSRDVVHEDTWEFIHPSFHEYFAACHAAAVLLRTEGKEVPVGSALIASTTTGRQNSDTALGEVFLMLGREGFQLLLSRLLLCIDQNDRTNLRDHARKTLTNMANVLSRDLTIQQYLYDTGFVDVAAFELYEWWRLVEDKDPRWQVAAEGRMAVAKLVAHYHYGTKDGEVDGRPVGRRLGLEIMDQAVTEARELEIATSGDRGGTRTALFGWYVDFFDDHVLNRRESTGAPTATELSIEREWADFEPRAFDIHQLFERRAGELASPFSLLRAAHFFGHRANHVLIWFSRASQGRTLTPEIASVNFDFGRRAVERAIVLRLAALALTDGGINALRRISKLVDPHFVTGAVTRALLQYATDEQEIINAAREGIERFASAAQGIGDLANQHVVLGVLLLWRWLFFEGDSAAQLYDEARSMTSLSVQLWALAGETGVRATHNDGAIRYLIYLAGLKERLRIAESVVERRRVPTDDDISTRLEAELDRLEQDYGLTYEIGGESTPRDVGIFVTELRRRRMNKAVRRALSQR